MSHPASLRRWQRILDAAVDRYYDPSFIDTDPIQIPHRFSNPRDREIIGFWVAMLAWGQRKTIIASGERLIELMDGAPYAFITQHRERDRKRFLKFVHRTFQPEDALYFLSALQSHYRVHDSLEDAFRPYTEPASMRKTLTDFHDYFFSLGEHLPRTRKHIATPIRGSSCKRLCMYLRWMVRPSEGGVDFGLWTRIHPSELHIPLDVHVFRVAESLGMTRRKKPDWAAVEEITETLKKIRPEDPTLYDYALFSLSADKSLREEIN